MEAWDEDAMKRCRLIPDGCQVRPMGSRSGADTGGGNLADGRLIRAGRRRGAGGR